MARIPGRRGPRQQKKDTFKSTGFMDQVIWELEAFPHLSKNEDSLAEIKQYLFLHGAEIHYIYTPQVNREVCYVITHSSRKATKPLYMYAVRKGIILKRTNSQINDEYRSSILKKSLTISLDDIMWKQGLDSKLIEEHRFIYLIHNSKNIFYVGQSLTPKARLGSRFFSIRNAKDDYVTDFIYKNLPNSRKWHISFVSLKDCEDLLLKTCTLPAKNREQGQQILAQFQLYKSSSIKNWLKNQSQQDTFSFIDDLQKNKNIPPSLRWCINMMEQAMISVYQLHFNIANNPCPQPLPLIYKDYCNDTLPCGACQRRAKPKFGEFSETIPI